MKRTTNKGFTLVELMVTIFLVGLIGVAINQFQSQSSIKSREAQARLLATDQARITLRRFLEEVRTTSQSSNGSYALASTSASTLMFYSDLYGDGQKERVRYFLDSSNSLKKGITKPSGSPAVYNDASESVTKLTGSLSNPGQNVFYYYDTNDALLATATPSLVRSVRALLVLTVDPKAPSTTVSFETRATFRNLKDNY